MRTALVEKASLLSLWGIWSLCFMCGEYAVKRCKGYASLPLLVCYAPMCTASRAKARCGSIVEVALAVALRLASMKLLSTFARESVLC